MAVEGARNDPDLKWQESVTMGSQQNTRFGRRTAVLKDAFARDDELREYLERIAKLTYLPVARTGEATQITEYAPGEYYDFHWDTNLEVARLATYLLYIADIPEGEGGETSFPLLTAARRSSV